MHSRLKLEKKEKTNERLGFSPDLADAIALTFAEELPMQVLGEHQRRQEFMDRMVDYYDGPGAGGPTYMGA